MLFPGPVGLSLNDVRRESFIGYPIRYTRRYARYFARINVEFNINKVLYHYIFLSIQIYKNT